MCEWSIVAASGKERSEEGEESHGRGESGRYRRKEPLVFQ